MLRLRHFTFPAWLQEHDAFYLLSFTFKIVGCTCHTHGVRWGVGGVTTIYIKTIDNNIYYILYIIHNIFKPIANLPFAPVFTHKIFE